MENERPPKYLLVFVSVFMNLIWALSYPLSKIMMTGLSAYGLSFWRLFGGSLILLAVLKRRDIPEKITLKDISFLLGMGIIGCGVAVVLQYVGTDFTTSANIALIVGVESVIISILAWIFLKEIIELRTLFCLVLAFVGVSLVSVDFSKLSLISGPHLLGNGLMLLAVVCFSFYTVLGKALSPRWGITALSAIPFSIAVLFYTPWFWWTHPAEFERSFALTSTEIYGVAYVAVLATGVGYLLWNWVLKWTSAVTLSYSLFVQPIAGALFSMWILGEQIGINYYLGTALVLTAIGFEHRPPSKAN